MIWFLAEEMLTELGLVVDINSFYGSDEDDNGIDGTGVALD